MVDNLTLEDILADYLQATGASRDASLTVLAGACAAVGCQAEQLPDLIAHVVHIAVLLRTGALLKDAKCHFHASKRRAKFVGDVSEETLLPGDVFAEAARHVVERFAEAAEFVVALRVHARLKLSLRHLPCRAGHLPDAARDAAHERKPQQH